MGCVCCGMDAIDDKRVEWSDVECLFGRANAAHTFAHVGVGMD